MATTPSIETSDWMALKARVDTLATDPSMKCYEPGEIVTPDKDNFGPKPFILLSDVTNAPDRGGRIDPALHVRSGVLMLTVQWPLSRAITHAQFKEIGGQIAAHFPADACMSFGRSRLRVAQDSAALPAYVDGAYRVLVVRVFWSSM